MRRRAGRSFLRHVGGATAVEFAIISLPLLLVVFGIIEYGRVMWTREALQEIAIAGARCMGMTQTACGTGGVYSATMSESYVESQGTTWSIPLTSANVTLNPTATCGGVSGFSQVTVSYTMNTFVPYLVRALAGGTLLTATACFPNHS